MNASQDKLLRVSALVPDRSESESRAWLIAARASQRLGDKTAAQQQLAHAKEILIQLQQRWSAEIFKRYLTRPDIQGYYKQLG